MIIQIKINMGMDVTYAGGLDGLLVPLTMVAQTPVTVMSCYLDSPFSLQHISSLQRTPDLVIQQ